MTWTIATEHHLSPATQYDGSEVPPIEFFYAVRRSDGSLLFRAETLKFAEEIVGRLVHTHSERKAA